VATLGDDEEVGALTPEEPELFEVLDPVPDAGVDADWA
jgi:hypothetical protein